MELNNTANKQNDSNDVDNSEDIQNDSIDTDDEYLTYDYFDLEDGLPETPLDNYSALQALDTALRDEQIREKFVCILILTHLLQKYTENPSKFRIQPKSTKFFHFVPGYV